MTTTLTISSPQIQRPISATYRPGLIINLGPHLVQAKNSQLIFFTNSGAEATSPPIVYTFTFSDPILHAIETEATADHLSPTQFQLTTRLGQEPRITILSH